MQRHFCIFTGSFLYPHRKVIGHKQDADNNSIGTVHTNPTYDTQLYQVQFSEDHVEVYSANAIAQSFYSQLDNEGHQCMLMETILDFKSDDMAIPHEEE
jgi:hypothetical protein